MCACPGQVAHQVRQLRHLIRYERECAGLDTAPSSVHHTIAASALEAHAIMEGCLDRVLKMEGWDRKTLKMPEGLRKLRDDLIARGD